jgi:hypothetical protein
MKGLSVVAVVGMFLVAVGSRQIAAVERTALSLQSFQVIVNQVGTANGFGFGTDVCPLGCQLPAPPAGSSDPQPFDTPDSPCALTQSWTHDFRADLPPGGAQIIGAMLLLNVAGIQPDVFPSMLTADTLVFPLNYFDQGPLGSGVVPVPLNLSDLGDGILSVTIKKGYQARTTTVCDDQFYDTSMLLMLIQLP